MPPHYYLIDEIDPTYGNICIVGVMYITQNMYILGDSFLRAWYSVYDFENNRIGLV